MCLLSFNAFSLQFCILFYPDEIHTVPSLTAHSKAVAHAYIDDCTECYIVFELFFYKSAAIIVSYVEIQHKTAFEAKSLDFLAFYLISLILTEMFSYII